MISKKTVKLMPQKPMIGIFRTPVYNTIEKITLDIDKIRLCLVSKCLVDEYLNDGTLLRLNLANYTTDNNPTVEVVEEVPEPVKEEYVKSEPVTEFLPELPVEPVVVEEVPEPIVEVTETIVEHVDTIVEPMVEEIPEPIVEVTEAAVEEKKEEVKPSRKNKK